MKTEKLTPDQIIVLSFAFRHALGQSTYATTCVISELIRLKDQLPETFKARISREIQAYQDEYEMVYNNSWSWLRCLFDKSRHVRVKAYYGDGERFEEIEAIRDDEGRYYTKGMRELYRAEEI